MSKLRFKLYTSRDCPKCEDAKAVAKALKDKGFSVKKHSIDEADGLAEASLDSVLSTPTLVLMEGDKEQARWIGEFKQSDVLNVLEM